MGYEIPPFFYVPPNATRAELDAAIAKDRAYWRRRQRQANVMLVLVWVAAAVLVVVLAQGL